MSKKHHTFTKKQIMEQMEEFGSKMFERPLLTEMEKKESATENSGNITNKCNDLHCRDKYYTSTGQLAEDEMDDIDTELNLDDSDEDDMTSEQIFESKKKEADKKKKEKEKKKKKEEEKKLKEEEEKKSKKKKEKKKKSLKESMFNTNKAQGRNLENVSNEHEKVNRASTIDDSGKVTNQYQGENAKDTWDQGSKRAKEIMNLMGKFFSSDLSGKAIQFNESTGLYELIWESSGSGNSKVWVLGVLYDNNGRKTLHGTPAPEPVEIECNNYAEADDVIDGMENDDDVYYDELFVVTDREKQSMYFDKSDAEWKGNYRSMRESNEFFIEPKLTSEEVARVSDNIIRGMLGNYGDEGVRYILDPAEVRWYDRNHSTSNPIARFLANHSKGIREGLSVLVSPSPELSRITSFGDFPDGSLKRLLTIAQDVYKDSNFAYTVRY